VIVIEAAVRAGADFSAVGLIDLGNYAPGEGEWFETIRGGNQPSHQGRRQLGGILQNW
jgi:hypothetical protein